MRVTTLFNGILLAALFAVSAFACTGPPYIEACVKYVDCDAHATEVLGRAPTAGIEERYGVGGTCFQGAYCELTREMEACERECLIKITENRAELNAADEELGPCE